MRNRFDKFTYNKVGVEFMEEGCSIQSYLQEYYCILEQMISKMSSAQLTWSISYNFIVQMIPHHQAAILMSCNLLKYTKNTDLQDIAFNIIQEQTKSIINMENIICNCQNLINCSDDLYYYQYIIDDIIQTMFNNMSVVCFNNDIDINFIREMIPHHEGAIAMAKTTLEYDICPELRPILKAIITSQSRGVEQLNALLTYLCKCE